MSETLFLDSPDRVFAKAWADEDFKVALLANPREALRSQGIQVPEGITVNVYENPGPLKMLENSDNVINLVLPEPPDLDLVEEPLDAAADSPLFLCRCGACRCGGCRCGGCSCGGCSCACVTCHCV
jgi:hypothetical protein